MLLQEIIQILNNRLEYLKSRKTIAVSAGDLEQIYELDFQISETLTTISQLKTLVV